MTEEIQGIIYPLPKNLADKLLDKSEAIFIKYSTHQIISKKMASCSKVLIYESNAGMILVGEGDIKRIELLKVNEIVEKYKSLLFMSKSEIDKYCRDRKQKLLHVFHLQNIHRYPEPIKLDHPLTMVGEYITKDKYDSLII